MSSLDRTQVDSDEMISLCEVHAGTGLFGIDTREIREVLGAVAPQRVPLAPEYIAGIMPYRGEVLTIVSLRVLLGLERGFGARCALVLDDENEEQFGLMVDGVGGVVSMARSALEPNPSVLDTRSNTLSDGLYMMPDDVMVRLDARQLRPSQLMESGLHGTSKQERTNEYR
jgi:purine-binding chemotaxis protein CheW